MLGAVISAIVTIAGLAFGYVQWRRDVHLKLGQIREEVSVELIRQRVRPYSEFMQRLERLSSAHLDDIKASVSDVASALDLLQEAVYGPVGLLASHTTRRVLLYVRVGIRDLQSGIVDTRELAARLWSLHFALRADLGISQPDCPSEIERVHAAVSAASEERIEVSSARYPWHDDLALRQNPK